MLFAAATVQLLAQTAPINIRGLVTDSTGTPVPSATVQLEREGLTATTGADGRFALTAATSLRESGPAPLMASIHRGGLFLSLPERTEISVTAYDLRGQASASIRKRLDAGSHSLDLPKTESGVGFFKVRAGGRETLIRAFALDGEVRSAALGYRGESGAAFLAKRASAAAPFHDQIVVTKAGFQKAYRPASKADENDVAIKMLPENAPKFSFFVTSMRTLQELAKNDSGFGGDFRFGETGQGAGLRGADKICATIAEKSMPGSSVKGWRAFLSVTADTYGRQVNAIDRVGPGPWYDRLGRLLAPTKADLLNVRPADGDPTIQLDFPNEWGIPNHRPDPNAPEEDNHHMVTGSDTQGRLKSSTATCKDWTTSVHSTANGMPSCGFAWPRGGRVSNSGSHWMSTFDAPGCARGIEIVNGGGPTQTAARGGWIGGGGGYGGFYCFALNP
jgi:hypothetical protein